MQDKFNTLDGGDNIYEKSIRAVESGQYLTITDEEMLSDFAQELVNNFATPLAIKLTRHWTKIHTSNDEAWLYLALSLSQKLGSEKEAEKAFKKAISLNPNDSEAYLQLGFFYEHLGRLDDALACYYDAKSKNMKEAELYHSIGAILSIKEKFQEAKQILEECIQIDPLYSEALLDLGATYQKLGLKEKAIAAFERFTELEPNEYIGWESLGGVFLELDRSKEAHACYDKVIELSKDPKAALFAKGFLYLSSRQLKESIQEFKKVLETSHDDPYTLFQLALTFHGIGETEEAISCYLLTIKILKNQGGRPAEIISESWYGLSRAYLALKHFDKALNAINNSIALFPTEQRYAELKSNILEEKKSDVV